MAGAPVQSLVPDQAICPICDRAVRAKRMRKLYNVPVCYKCSNAFANWRQLAWIIDYLALMIVSVLVGVLVEMFLDAISSSSGNSSSAGGIIWFLFIGVVIPLFFYCKDGFAGYSPGKWLCGVRVVD